jgi:hypothetical protein
MPNIASSLISKAYKPVPNVSKEGLMNQALDRKTTVPFTPPTTPQISGSPTLKPPAPTTPVKETTVSNPNGGSTTTEYHAPEQSNEQKKQGLLSQLSGAQNQLKTQQDAGYGENDVPQYGTGGKIVPKSQEYAPNQELYGRIATNLATKASQPSPEYTDLLKRSSEAYKTAADTNQIIAKNKMAAMNNPGYTLDTGIGRAGMIAQNYGLQGQNALTTAQGLGSLAGTATTQQGVQQSGLGTAGSLAAPVTTAGLFSPVSGEPVNPELMGGIMNSAISSIQSGADINDPNIQKLVSIYGPAGTALLFNALKGNGGTGGTGGFNPTSQSAGVQQTIAQGAQQGGKAYQFSNSLDQLKGVSTRAIEFLNQNQLLNPVSNKLISQPIKEYITTVADPAAGATYNDIMNSINSFKAQISGSLSNGNLTPTAQTNQVTSTDPSTLSAPDLAKFLNDIVVLGEDIKGRMQKQAKDSSYTGYVGTPAATTGTFQNQSEAVSPEQQTAQWLGGIGTEFYGGASGLLDWVAKL